MRRGGGGSGLGKIMVFVAEKTFLADVLAIPMDGTTGVKFRHCFMLAQTRIPISRLSLSLWSYFRLLRILLMIKV